MSESGILTNAGSEPEERVLEAALRPKNLDDFVGQARVRQQLSLVLEASKIRERTADHVLLSGPPGLGKTTLSMIIAAEMNAPLRISSGPAIQHAGDLAAILSSLTEGEVLFLDEIHRMSRPAEEMLYMAMEDFRVDIIVGKGAGATAIPLELPPFTLVGATTRAGLLPGPLRDRFGFTGHLEFYSVEELELVLAPFGHDALPEGQLRGLQRNRLAFAWNSPHCQPPVAPRARLGPGEQAGKHRCTGRIRRTGYVRGRRARP